VSDLQGKGLMKKKMEKGKIVNIISYETDIAKFFFFALGELTLGTSIYSVVLSF